MRLKRSRMVLAVWSERCPAIEVEAGAILLLPERGRVEVALAAEAGTARGSSSRKRLPRKLARAKAVRVRSIPKRLRRVTSMLARSKSLSE